MNVDRWETLQNEPEAFERGGCMYEKVVREIGSLRDDQHFSIIALPGKVRAGKAAGKAAALLSGHFEEILCIFY